MALILCFFKPNSIALQADYVTVTANIVSQSHSSTSGQN